VSHEAIDAEYVALRRDLTAYARAGGRLAVVKAPPGSGKTHTLIEVLSALTADRMQIAVATQTNSQADDMCVRWAMDHPEVRVVRFSSKGVAAPMGFPASVGWITDKRELPTGSGVTIATTAKWSVTDLSGPYDLLAIDEAWQMSWADLMQCALVSERFLMIGDPGQIPPVVTVDVRRWETSPRAPHKAAPDVVLTEPALDSVRFVGSLPACRRLPNESVDFIKPFYDFDFDAYIPRGARGLELSDGWGDALALGRPLVLTVPTPDSGPPVEVDHEIAECTAKVVGDLLSGRALLRFGAEKRVMTAADVGITSSHRVMNSALSAALGPRANQIRVDTPERWQGLERPVMIAIHPLSGVSDPSAFDLETGRLCVMASRHQSGFIMLTRDHVGETLRNYVPAADQAPGCPDIVGRGHDAHLRFWTQLEETDSVIPLT
jgi:hypothetical protein